MSMRDATRMAATLLALLSWAGMATADGSHGIGRVATTDEIARWDIDVRPDGEGLPVGSGSVADGRRLYRERCIACHGDRGQGGPMDRLAGGQGTLASATPVRTVGSYWPYATTLFDYVRRAMPFNAPQSLNSDELYAVTAYILFLNEIVPEGTTLDASGLTAIRMPNRYGFTGDPRPDAR